MIEAGAATLPDLNAKFIVAEDIMEALKAKPNIWSRKSSYLLSLHSLILHWSRWTKVHNHVQNFSTVARFSRHRLNPRWSSPSIFKSLYP
jgi:hypothetical protein